MKYLGILLLLLFGGSAQADILADGITYSVSATGLSTSTATFDIHISGINGVADTEGGRTSVESFAFSTNSLLPGLSGTSSFGTFQTGGLNANGCNGSGGFFCFTANTPLPSITLPADSTLDIPFTLMLVSGTFDAWAASDPHFKINWEGSKNNYDLVSLGGGLSVNPLIPTPIPGAVWLFGTGLLGLISLRKINKSIDKALTNDGLDHDPFINYSRY